MGNSQNPLARMAGRRETDCLKPIDKAIFGMVSESSGRNESEGIGGPKTKDLTGKNPCVPAKPRNIAPEAESSFVG